MINQLPDPGLGEKFYQNKSRMVNKDGTFNAKRTGLKLHLYHYLISISAFKFSIFLILAYLICNLLFTGIYAFIGIENLKGQAFENPFLKAFLFSMQTFTTVGFGSIYPQNYSAGLVSGMEAMFGLMFFAFATGIVYGRFSKPSISLRFSEKTIISNYKDNGKALMIRLVNARPNTMIEMSARIIMAVKINEGDNISRKYYNPDLETANIVFFPLPWTLVHAINEDSPLTNYSELDFAKSDAEFIIHIKGFNETYAQVTNTIYSYKHDEVQWGARYKRNYILNDDGAVEYDINKIGEIELIENF